VKRTLLALSILALAPAAFGQARDTQTGVVGQPHVAPEAPWGGAAQVLFSNGPIITGTGNGAGGANTSQLQGGDGSAGFNCNGALPARIADDFVVPAGQTWVVDQVTVFAYQTGSSTTSTFTGGSLEIRTAAPPGGAVVFGDDTTNRLAGSAFTNIYRLFSTDPLTGTARPIMANTLDTGGLTLGPGTYWINVGLTGSLASGPWCVPVTSTNVGAQAGNALQFFSGAWNPVVDGSTGQQKAQAFLVEGTFVVPAPAPVNNPLALILLGLALFGVGAFAVSRRV
jgi:hypothetical protein